MSFSITTSKLRMNMMTAPSSFFTGTTSTRHRKQLPAGWGTRHCGTKAPGWAEQNPAGACPHLPPPRPSCQGLLPHPPPALHLPGGAAALSCPLQLAAGRSLHFLGFSVSLSLSLCAPLWTWLKLLSAPTCSSRFPSPHSFPLPHSFPSLSLRHASVGWR